MKTLKQLSCLVRALILASIVFHANLASAQDLWRFPLGEAANDVASGSPAIGDDGTIYIGSCDGTFYAIKPDGTLKWPPFTDPKGGMFGWTAAIGDDGTIYANSGYAFYALNPNNGTIKWSAEPGSIIVGGGSCLFLGAPAIAWDGTIYIGSNANFIYALNPNNGQDAGKTIWINEGEYMKVQNPVIGPDDSIYFAATSFESDFSVFFAYDRSGILKWRYEVVDPILLERTYVPYSEDTSAAIGNDGTIYFVAPGYHWGVTLYAFRPDGTETGAEIMNWSYNNHLYTHWKHWTLLSSPVTGKDGTIYFGEAGNIFAVSPDGAYMDSWGMGETWGDGWTGNVGTPAIGADNKIYVASQDSSVYARDPFDPYYTKYTILENVYPGGTRSSPAINHNGVLWIGGTHDVWGVQTDTLGPADSSWPLDRANLKRNARADWHIITGILFTRMRSSVIEQRLEPGISQSLVSKLDSAIKSFDAMQIVASRNKLNAFTNEVKAQRGKKIPVRIADDLISQAQEIMDILALR